MSTILLTLRRTGELEPISWECYDIQFYSRVDGVTYLKCNSVHNGEFTLYLTPGETVEVYTPKP